MSHFLTFVLVGGVEADAAARADELLRPYFAPDGPYSLESPDAKCDGYVLGGRFDGQLFGAPPEYNLTPAEFQARYGFDKLKDENNVRRASEVPGGLVPYAVVTPEGVWFDCERKERAAWAAEVGALLRRYADCSVVAFDCHC